MKTEILPLAFKGNLSEVILAAILCGLQDAGHSKTVPWLTVLSNVAFIVMRILWVEGCANGSEINVVRSLACKVWSLSMNGVLDVNDEETVQFLKRGRIKIGD